MSGKPWPRERKTSFGKTMSARWAAGAFADRKPAVIPQAERQRRSARAAALNERMKTDPSLKGAMLAGVHRSYLNGQRQVELSAAMTATMQRPEMRARAAEHCRQLPQDEASKKKRWDARRGFAIPDDLRNDYRRLVRKVGSAEARRIIREEISRRERRRCAAQVAARSSNTTPAGRAPAQSTEL